MSKEEFMERPLGLCAHNDYLSYLDKEKGLPKQIDNPNEKNGKKSEKLFISSIDISSNHLK